MNATWRGLGWAFLAYAAWGLLPLFWKHLRHVPTPEIVAHRVVWSAAVMTLFLAARGKLRAAVDLLRLPPRALALIFVAAALIGANWLIYVYSILTDRLLESSLGYYVNPLLNVLLGGIFLGESLGGLQVAAFFLACAGVGVYAWSLGGLPWISVSLAVTFALYGLLKKRSRLDALSAQWIEALLLTGPALAYLVLRWRSGDLHFLRHSAHDDAMLIAAGGMILPLLWFSRAAQLLRLSTLGFIQYLSPTIQFLLAVLVFREPFRPAQAAAFAFIWAALALWTLAGISARTAGPATAE